MSDLILYDQACRAIERAVNVDEVRDIFNKAEAIRHYAKQAKNRTLEIRCAKIRMRAERRIGEIRAADKSLGRVARGGKPYQDTTSTNSEQVGSAEDMPPTLEELGIDRKLAARSAKMAAVPAHEFENLIAEWERVLETENERVTTDLLRAGQKEQQRQSRLDLAAALSDTSHELTGDRTFPCVYLDPAYSRKAGVGDRAYENHYRTEKWADIISIMGKVAPRLQPNAWAFIWIPRAHMLALHPVKYQIAIDDGSIHEITIKQPLIWAIARALGMSDYSTCFVWTKTDEDHPDEHGTFLLARDQDEILVLYKKGDGLPRPKSENIFGSNHRERSRPLGHSKKPPFYRQMIARMTEGLPVLELFARHDEADPLPPNWEVWGNESVASPQGDVDTATDATTWSSSARTEIPEEASGTAREAPGGSVLAEPSVVAVYGLDESGAAGEAEPSSRLVSFPDDDLLLVKRPSIGGAR